MTDFEQIQCKKCGQSVSFDDLLDHIIEVHRDYETVRLMSELKNLTIVGGTNN